MQITFTSQSLTCIYNNVEEALEVYKDRSERRRIVSDYPDGEKARGYIEQHTKLHLVNI